MPESNSILETIRKMIGPSVSYDVFDTDLIVHINSAFSRLCQLGVGPDVPFTITGTDETWDDFVCKATPYDVIQYIYFNVKMDFDTPSNSTVSETYTKKIEKLEWTLKEVARFGY